MAGRSPRERRMTFGATPRLSRPISACPERSRGTCPERSRGSCRERSPGTGSRIADSGRPMLNVANLSVDLGGFLAVREVNLEVRTGELVVLLGANGAGK